MGKFFTRSRIWMKLVTRVYLKRWNDRGEFALDRAKSKNNIAENSVALGHDTHNALLFIQQPNPWLQLHHFLEHLALGLAGPAAQLHAGREPIRDQDTAWDRVPALATTTRLRSATSQIVQVRCNTGSTLCAISEFKAADGLDLHLLHRSDQIHWERRYPLGEIPSNLLTYRRCASKFRLAITTQLCDISSLNLLYAIVSLIPFKVTPHSSNSVEKYKKSFMQYKKGPFYLS